MSFKVATSISAAGIGAADNDDCADSADTPYGLYAWVIDGGTSVADRNYLGQARGDVAWFSNALSAALRRLARDGLAPKALHAAAAAEVAALYADACANAERPPLYAQPIAAVTLMRITGERLALYQLADCAGFIRRRDGRTERLTVGGNVEDQDGSRQRLEASQARVGFAPKAVWAAQLSSLRGRREAQIQVVPRSISTPAADGAFGGWELSFDLADARAVVLMSDGFERYAAKYELGDDGAMIDCVLSEGAQAVLEAVRTVEDADPDCRRFPRLKASDDATCLVLERSD
jgi:hypothetical protein